MFGRHQPIRIIRHKTNSLSPRPSLTLNFTWHGTRLIMTPFNCARVPNVKRVHLMNVITEPSRVVGNLRWPPKTCHSSSESWEYGDSEYVIRYAGKIRPFLKFQYLCNTRNYFFWSDLRRLPSHQTPNIWYVLVANMLESNPVVRNISEIHLRLHKLRCIPILTLHIQHGSHSSPPAASL